ncbi:hypothetical protein MMC24_007613 [Lignoscripta atroalba]|nr:hypothetical protein [Lignoscripta atroalba]
MRAIIVALSLSFWVLLIKANVEKVIFLAPIYIHQSPPDDYPDVYKLQLDVLSPSKSSLRTYLNASFPSLKDESQGSESWFILDGLRPQQRYEQPTAFSISTLLFPDIDESPILNTSLYSYVESRQQHRRYLDTTETSDYSDFEWRGQFHGLLLHIRAAADYYTTNRTLMIDVPPVKVDIILDPYILNIFPKSLLPTAAYLIVLVIVSWFLSNIIWRWLDGVSQIPAEVGKRQSGKRD